MAIRLILSDRVTNIFFMYKATFSLGTTITGNLKANFSSMIEKHVVVFNHYSFTNKQSLKGDASMICKIIGIGPIMP